MPIEIWYIFALIGVICFIFLVLKRPIYECMFYGYILMIIITGEYKNFFTYIIRTSSDTLFYSIMCFLVLSKVLDITHAIDTVVNVIISIFGRIKGGAAFTAVLCSTFMGALSGSGAGNVATTGIFTIPAMKKSGMPAHLAANIESASSTMGNMIPPSGVILTALACYNEFSGTELSQSVFWLSCWGVAIYFIIQRLLTVFLFCNFYKVQPMDKNDIPSLKETLKKGWLNLLLPLMIIMPFVLDYFFKDNLFKDRLGAGSSNFSSSLLLFTPALASIYAMLVNRKSIKLAEFFENIKGAVSSVVSVGATVFFAYCISNLFSATNIGANIGNYFSSFDFSIPLLAFLIPLITAILGMVFPGSAQTRIFGTTIISIFAAAGGEPLLAAVLLPAITGAMEGMTPPLAICMYTAMGIAGSDLKQTTLNCLIWVVLHYLVSVISLLGILPIVGI